MRKTVIRHREWGGGGEAALVLAPGSPDSDPSSLNWLVTLKVTSTSVLQYLFCKMGLMDKEKK